MHCINIFRSADVAIDFYSSGSEPGRTVVMTFTPFNTEGEKVLDGSGFASELLANNGFDVVAFKTRQNVWYQDLPRPALASVTQFLDSHSPRHARRVAYGTSMGGYAAIQFSAALELDAVLALSPQFEVDKAYDTRWKVLANSIDYRYRIDANAISVDCTYFVAYDPENLDKLHVDKLRPLIAPSKLVEIKTRHAGHPCGYLLSEVGALKPMMLSILRLNTVGNLAPAMNKRKQSKIYLYRLSRSLTKRGKYASALVAIDRAIGLDGNAPELHLQRSLLLDRLGRPNDAMKAIKDVCRASGDGHRWDVVSKNAAEHRNYSDALELIDRGVAWDAGTLGRHFCKLAISKALRDNNGELAAWEGVLEQSCPLQSRHWFRIVWLYARQGTPGHWVRAFATAKRGALSLLGR